MSESKATNNRPHGGRITKGNLIAKFHGAPGFHPEQLGFSRNGDLLLDRGAGAKRVTVRDALKWRIFLTEQMAGDESRDIAIDSDPDAEVRFLAMLLHSIRATRVSKDCYCANSDVLADVSAEDLLAMAEQTEARAMRYRQCAACAHPKLGRACARSRN